MWWEPTGTGMATAHEERLGAMLAGAAGDRLVRVSLVVMTTAGLMSAVINLLVPLQLHANGVSTSAIGAAFGDYCGGIHRVQRGDGPSRRASGEGARGGLAMAASMIVILIPVASEASAALVGFLFARAPLTAVMFTVAFPLGALGARRAGITVGGVAALINIAWSVSMLSGAGGVCRDRPGRG